MKRLEALLGYHFPKVIGIRLAARNLETQNDALDHLVKSKIVPGLDWVTSYDKFQQALNSYGKEWLYPKGRRVIDVGGLIIDRSWYFMEHILKRGIEDGFLDSHLYPRLSDKLQGNFDDKLYHDIEEFPKLLKKHDASSYTQNAAESDLRKIAPKEFLTDMDALAKGFAGQIGVTRLAEELHRRMRTLDRCLSITVSAYHGDDSSYEYERYRISDYAKSQWREYVYDRSKEYYMRSLFEIAFPRTKK